MIHRRLSAKELDRAVGRFVGYSYDLPPLENYSDGWLDRRLSGLRATTAARLPRSSSDAGRRPCKQPLLMLSSPTGGGIFPRCHHSRYGRYGRYRCAPGLPEPEVKKRGMAILERIVPTCGPIRSGTGQVCLA